MIHQMAKAISPLAFKVNNAEMISCAKMEARAALKAIREPSEAVIRRVFGPCASEIGPMDTEWLTLVAGWKELIDSILAEEA